MATGSSGFFNPSPPAGSSPSSCSISLEHGIPAKNCKPSARNPSRGVKIKALRDSSAPASDDYTVLQTSPTASKRDIKAAYRKLALQFHPDVCKEGDCELKFKQINNAYEALMTKAENRGGREGNDLRWEDLFGEGEEGEWEEWVGYEGGVAAASM